MTSPPPPSFAPDSNSVSDGMTEVVAPGRLPKSVFPTSPHALPVGARIGEFEVHRLIGEGGFGIVYLCYDQALDRYVALKEYMPFTLAARQDSTLAIVVKSKQHQETFEAGLKSFINEARLLARFDHPSLLKVYRFWQANGTAYMTMPYYEGPTLKQALAALEGPPDETTLRSWLLPMLDALEEIHRASCYHRDIAPDNILLTPAGPLLLDFGAARRVIGDMTQALTVVLKPGFAPIEQYGDAATMSQGAWTDLYALAGVVHFAITGRPPMSAVERLMDDRLEPLSHRVAGRYSPALLAAVDAALCVRPQDRPQSVADFRAMLNAAPDGQSADLSLWGEDDAPTAFDAATAPGALGDSSHSQPRTLPTGHTAHESSAAAINAVLPDAPLGPLPSPEPRPLAVPMQPEVVAPPPVTVPAPAPTIKTPKALPDDQPRTQFMPRSPTAVAMGSGAGLAPLSGATETAEQPHKLGLPAPLPPRPPVAERTAMPSLLPTAAALQAALPMGAAQQSSSILPPVANSKQGLNWALLLSSAAFVLAAAAAIWTFTRPDTDALTSEPQAPAPVTPNTVSTPSDSVASPAAGTELPLTPAPVPAPPVDLVSAKSLPPPPAAPKPAPSALPNDPAPGAAQNGETHPVSAAPRGAPPIRLGNASTSRVESDSPLVLTKPTATVAGPAKLDPEPPAPVVATPSASPRSIARCADIRQRAGLEDLNAEERQFLRTQCR
ncbi:MAG: serine/threonine protein kinase [Rhizobacter sp.]